MLKFITNTVLFIIGTLLISLSLYIIKDYFLNSKNDENAIYIWGDSQTYQGINIQIIRNNLNKPIYSYAKHGAGIYDLLVFSERVPNNSTIVLGISKPVQLRPKSRDRNTSGISITSLIEMYKNGYTIIELETIIKKNKTPIKTLQEDTKMYKYNDTIVLKEPIKLFEDIYDTIPSYLTEKQNLYKIGIEKLRDKKCNIIFIDFPYHLMLKEIEDKSLVKKETDKFSKWIINSSKKMEVDTLVLNINKQVMHDLTHLNEFGANQVSIRISEEIRKYERTTMYIKNCRDTNDYENCSTFEVYLKVEN